MRKRLLIGAVTIVGIWLAIWVGSLLFRSSVTSGAAHEWPGELGTLSAVEQRHPPRQMNRGAAQLIALAQPLGIDLAPRARSTPSEPQPFEFVRSQLTKWGNEQLTIPTPEVEPLPSESGEYLAARAASITAVVNFLLSSEPIVWAEDVRDPVAPLPNLVGHMQLQRILVARGLDRARFGDRGGWYDLQAAWHLARPLLDRHENISKLIALSIARNVNAAARKMPLPPPAWLSEMHAYDFRKAFLAGAQADAWQITDRVYGETTVDAGPLTRRAVDAIMAPYARMTVVDWADASRHVAMRVASTRDCDLDPTDLSDLRNAELAWWNMTARRFPTPNLDTIWQRVLRFTPEREATVRALALRAGEPGEPQSECADGQWIYSEDGKSFRFSREIPTSAPNQIPLEFSLDAEQGSKL